MPALAAQARQDSVAEGCTAGIELCEITVVKLKQGPLTVNAAAGMDCQMSLYEVSLSLHCLTLDLDGHAQQQMLCLHCDLHG